MPFSIIDPDAAEPSPEFFTWSPTAPVSGPVLTQLQAGQAVPGLLSVPSVLAFTDRLGAAYNATLPLAGALAAQLADARDLVYGSPDNGNVSLGESGAIDALGPPSKRALLQAGGNTVYSFFLGPLVAALTSYVRTAGAAAGLPPAACQSLAAFLRAANGCPDPSPAGGGVGSSYTWLVSPEFAALVSALNLGASVLPADCVFAPAGVVLATYDRATDTGAGGPALLTTAATQGQPTPLPYAPTRALAVSATTPADGTLPLLVTAATGAGQTATLPVDGQAAMVTAPDGGAVAAWADSLLQATAFARDLTGGGGTATVGSVQLVTTRLRALPS